MPIQYTQLGHGGGGGQSPFGVIREGLQTGEMLGNALTKRKRRKQAMKIREGISKTIDGLDWEKGGADFSRGVANIAKHDKELAEFMLDAYKSYRSGEQEDYMRFVEDSENYINLSGRIAQSLASMPEERRGDALAQTITDMRESGNPYMSGIAERLFERFVDEGYKGGKSSFALDVSDENIAMLMDSALTASEINDRNMKRFDYKKRAELQDDQQAHEIELEGIKQENRKKLANIKKGVSGIAGDDSKTKEQKLWEYSEVLAEDMGEDPAKVYRYLANKDPGDAIFRNYGLGSPMSSGEMDLDELIGPKQF